MKRIKCLSIVKWGGVICILLTLVAWQMQDGKHQPASVDDFIVELQRAFSDVRKLQADQTDESAVRRQMVEHHIRLSRRYPIYYDWWLQDGKNEDPHEWFGQGTLNDAISQRLAKHNKKGVCADVKKGIGDYLKACEQRREQRLKEFVEDSPEVIFTKQRVVRPSFYAYTEGLSDARDERNFNPGGSLNRFKMNGIWAKEECLLADLDGGFRDPDVHFDGEHLLFAWKKSLDDDDYHLYEMNLKNKEVNQITFGLGSADFEGIYLPDDNILFNSSRCGATSDCFYTEVSNLYMCDRQGRFMRQIGFDQVHTTTPTLLDDGRVVYTRWDYSDRGQIWTQPLFQMNSDGTGQSEYYGMNSWFPTTVVHPKQIPGSRKIMGTFIGHHTPQHGKLGIIDPEAGRDENEGVMFVAPMRKPEAERQDVYGQWGEQFMYPEPMNEREFLVSYTPLGYYVGRNQMRFNIYWMNVDGERELLVSGGDISCNHPTLAVRRERPFQRASSVDYERKDGVYYMQNIYEGGGLEGIEPGTVKHLRVVEIQYRSANVGRVDGAGKGGSALNGSPPSIGNGSWDLKKVWGVADVHEDGSAFFSVPARKPLYFQALNEKGQVVQTMRSWSTLQPGETQSCVGCHEHKNTVPVTTLGVSMAMKEGVQELRAEDDMGVRTFSYMKEIQPIWDRHCISCHDGVKHKMSLKGELKKFDNMSKRLFCDSYINLTHAYFNRYNSLSGNPDHPEVNWISSLSEPTMLKPYSAGAATSNIIKRMESGHGGAKVSSSEIRRVAMWIDLLVPYVGDYRENNTWTKDEREYYDYYDNNRIAECEKEYENIQKLIEYQKTQKK